jgi:hypothetical protein
MKKISLKIISTFYLLIISIVVFAQEKKLDIDVTTEKTVTTSSWYMQPWAWVVGGAVFILLLVSILRGGNKSTTQQL